jgi:hypothetical protein
MSKEHIEPSVLGISATDAPESFSFGGIDDIRRVCWNT